MTVTLQLSQRISRLAPLADVLALVDVQTGPVAPRESAIAAAQGHVLAADIALETSLPPHAIALRDGYAVRSDWSLDASSYAPAMLPSMPVRLDAGAKLPGDTDAVAPFDAVEADAGGAWMTMTVAPGDGVLPAGADGKVGDILLRAGTRLDARHVALLVAAGVPQVSVRAPRIRFVTAKPDGSGMIAGATAMLARDIESRGDRRPNGAISFADALRDDECDAVVAIGGTGSGRDDHAVTSLAEAGKVSFHGIGISPGETAALGFAGARPVLLLPGRLDAALAAWLLIGRGIMARLAGTADNERSWPATLSRKISSAIGLAEAVPVRCEGGQAEPLATGYWPLHALARADGWILIPADSEGCPAGTRVEVRPLP
jgi:molybdopterin biosynthesis enzyme